ncbi:hypothetical protein LOAG_14812, partial [Loa loa]
ATPLNLPIKEAYLTIEIIQFTNHKLFRPTTSLLLNPENVCGSSCIGCDMLFDCVAQITDPMQRATRVVFIQDILMEILYLFRIISHGRAKIISCSPETLFCIGAFIFSNS